MDRLKRDPPDQHPRKPSFTVPAGTCDCHFHVVGPQRWYPFDPTVPVDCPDSTFEDALKLHEALGITRGLLVQSGLYQTQYQQTLNLLYRLADRWRGVVMLAPDVTDQELDVLSNAGVVGLRCIAHVGLPDEELIRRVQERCWLPHFYPGRSDAEFSVVCDRILKTSGNFVLEHVGMPDPSQGTASRRFKTILQLIDSGRCWVKISAVFSRETSLPFPDVTPFIRNLVERAPSRILWGTDWPHLAWPEPMVNDGDLMDLLLRWVPEEDLLKQILVENPSALFGFPDLPH
jgi:predicted TIM-barrel fold metal-dependent hydrolase